MQVMTLCAEVVTRQALWAILSGLRRPRGRLRFERARACTHWRFQPIGHVWTDFHCLAPSTILAVAPSVIGSSLRSMVSSSSQVSQPVLSALRTNFEHASQIEELFLHSTVGALGHARQLIKVSSKAIGLAGGALWKEEQKHWCWHRSATFLASPPTDEAAPSDGNDQHQLRVHLTRRRNLTQSVHLEHSALLHQLAEAFYISALNAQDPNSRSETGYYEGNDHTPHLFLYNRGCGPEHDCGDDIDMQVA